MRFGNTEVRFLGGAGGCMTMLVLSIVVSVMATLLLNLVIR
jgi:hypothetical protein